MATPGGLGALTACPAIVSPGFDIMLRKINRHQERLSA